MSDEKKQAKNLFKGLTKNENSVLYDEVSLTNNLIKKPKKIILQKKIKHL